MIFEINKKYTIIGISEWMATTTKIEIQITRQINNRFVFKAKGKRKEFYLQPLKDNNLVFEGWDLPVRIDSEGDYVLEPGHVMASKIFRGNACINLIGDENVIKDYVENKNLNEIFSSKGEIVYCKGKEEKVLYPEIEVSHAVINRMKLEGKYNGISAII